ncbi:13923_t:CDS:2, partial [Entrophospora sp. SA101]
MRLKFPLFNRHKLIFETLKATLLDLALQLSIKSQKHGCQIYFLVVISIPGSNS